MTIFQAESIKQDFCVSVGNAKTLGKEEGKVYLDVAKKYSHKILCEAMDVLLKQKETDVIFIKSLFGLAIIYMEANDAVRVSVERTSRGGS